MRPVLPYLPRVTLAVFAGACTLFAFAALWVLVPETVHGFGGFVAAAIHDDQLYVALRNTAVLFAISVGLQLFIASVASGILTSISPRAMAFLLLPYACGVVAPAFALSVFLSTGIGPFDVAYADSVFAQRIAIALLDTWQWVGVLLVAVFLQINQIPRSFFQLADLEGMKVFKRWRLIVWPQIRSVFLFYVVFRALDWLRKSDVIIATFDRGAAGALQTIAMYINQIRFQSASQISGSETVIGDPYSSFLVLCQVIILFTASVMLTRKRLVDHIYMGSRLLHRTSDQTYRAPLKFRISKWLFWTVLCILTFGPLLWILSLSLQGADFTAGSDMRFHLLPPHPTGYAYQEILRSNIDLPQSGATAVRSGITYSLRLCSVSAVISFLLAVAGTYLFVADRAADKVRSAVLGFTLSLFFIPPVIAARALDTLKDWFPTFMTPSLELLFVYVTVSFVLCFVLLLMVCLTLPLSHFEQLLLEQRHRIKAFWFAYLRFEPRVLLVIAVLTFSSCWSEFFLSNMITSTESVKPFSVVLELHNQQYTVDYPVFAAGAWLSVLLSTMVPVLCYMLINLLWLMWMKLKSIAKPAAPLRAGSLHIDEGVR